MEILRTESITKQYAEHIALDNASLIIPDNSIYGILGPNGAGKTTLIRIINQITAPDSGKVFFKGKPLVAKDIEQIGYLPEERGLYPKMKVDEQLVYLARLKGMTKNLAKERMEHWLKKMEIWDWHGKKVDELSKGMQQKIQFISTVIHEPSLYIFDEPFSGFDPVNAEMLKKEILELHHNGASLILSTHNMESVEELCQEITLINRSKVVLQGKVAAIRQQYKKHLYRIHIKEEQLTQSASFEIVSQKKLQGQTEALVQLKEGVSNHELIQELITNHELYAFVEQLPSMQEVFIETVKKPNPSK